MHIVDNCTNGLGNYGGAGMQIGWNCHPYVDTCEFIDNVTGCGDNNSAYGGAVWIYGMGIGDTECDEPESGPLDMPDPIFVDCTFAGNTATNQAQGAGGAVAITCGKGQFYDCTFSDNDAANRGGAFFGKVTDGTIIDGCTFETTNSAELGGAIYFEGHPYEDDFDPARIQWNTFTGNTADRGGAIYIRDKHATVNHNIFSANEAELSAGAMWYGGTRAHDNADPFVGYVVNNLFGEDHAVNNASSDEHECVILLRQDSDNDLQVIVEFINNTVAGSTSLRGITLNNESMGSPLEVNCYNSIIYENSTALTDISIYDFAVASDLNIDYCNTEQGGFGGNNISQDPEFIGGADFHLDSGSPCIDAGSEFSNPVQEEVGTDLDGAQRVQGEIDMGCYEE